MKTFQSNFVEVQVWFEVVKKVDSNVVQKENLWKYVWYV